MYDILEEIFVMAGCVLLTLIGWQAVRDMGAAWWYWSLCGTLLLFAFVYRFEYIIHIPRMVARCLYIMFALVMVGLLLIALLSSIHVIPADSPLYVDGGAALG
ncbi:hypothetical protein BAAM0483_05310 [Bifidobacterium animalis subsp. animalis MCC 0483]|uniref:Uncharacterized protein n=1 Tax=Bifidobacterium animalis subsp. animalis MCC 0483 TaxID=1365955 RepID=A0AB34T8Y0_9BIFI|nr:hypothetical protein BAAM0483_05310 [Bifidobacterium animalis subsp. animalis MCC 0483]